VIQYIFLLQGSVMPRRCLVEGKTFFLLGVNASTFALTSSNDAKHHSKDLPKMGQQVAVIVQHASLVELHWFHIARDLLRWENRFQGDRNSGGLHQF
jgi:hypothetical protein